MLLHRPRLPRLRHDVPALVKQFVLYLSLCVHFEYRKTRVGGCCRFVILIAWESTGNSETRRYEAGMGYWMAIDAF
jgi:hypothetical protein